MGRGPTLAIIAMMLLLGINGVGVENRPNLQDESVVMSQFGGGTSLKRSVRRVPLKMFLLTHGLILTSQWQIIGALHR